MQRSLEQLQENSATNKPEIFIHSKILFNLQSSNFHSIFIKLADACFDHCANKYIKMPQILKPKMGELPVVAVIATHGVERVSLLLERALPSISRQTRPVDLVLVVSDDDLLIQSDYVNVKDSFSPALRNRVRLMSNARTRQNSGTGR